MRNTLTSVLASTLAGWRGTVGAKNTRQPPLMLQLYEYEACPFCRMVRQALTELDLDAVILPCPRGGTRFRPQAEQVGGRAQFPLLVDDNTGDVIYESRDIINHLASTYGQGRGAAVAAPGKIGQIGASLASLTRGMAGMHAVNRQGTEPPRELPELYSFESSPYSRAVREVLCELEVPYVLRNMGKASKADMGPPWVRQTFFADAPVTGRNRQILFDETGRLQVPYLVDPNTETALFESADIVAYLKKTYG
ncbi:glutathione S-transferase N-terminal domain-containing protein [uncultured Salinisphaera sp.]|uniref:glutathione S-transferase N-terminal domain-containing protein n=1 Tax=uncultured Salinisphaera sp. TaxID=359372 RepID=UPI0032B2FF1C